jgi:hypothetical protein
MSLEKKQWMLKLQLEIIWWIVTVIATFLLVYPIMNNMVDYQFLYANIIFILVFITYSRYLFLLKHTFLAYAQVVKFILIFASIPLVFKLVEYIFAYQDFLETEGLNSFDAYFRKGISIETRDRLLAYMSREYLFFGVGSVIAAVVLPFRLLISFWRVYNKSKKV